MIYNFRFDRDRRDDVLRRVKNESLLCQGWGGGEQGDLSLEREDYTEKCQERYELSSTRIPTNLSRIRNLRDGDLLVVPHLPENGTVSVHVVDGHFPECYLYLATDSSHLNNQIKVRASYGLDGQISIYNSLLAPWYGKLQWMRLPILPMKEYGGIFAELINNLVAFPEAKYPPSEIGEYFEALTQRLLEVLSEDLTKISPSGSAISFEKVCEYLLTDVGGYSIVARNQYDREGGDIDLRCVRDRSSLSPFESGQVTLFVQVKKHTGTSDAYAVEQLLRMMKREPGVDGCVMTLAENYTTEAAALAKKEGILLLNGESIRRLLLQALGRRRTIE